MKSNRRATTSSTIDCHEGKLSQIELHQKAEAQKDSLARRNIMKYSLFQQSKQTIRGWRTEHEECDERERRLRLGFKDGKKCDSFEADIRIVSGLAFA